MDGQRLHVPGIARVAIPCGDDDDDDDDRTGSASLCYQLLPIIPGAVCDTRWLVPCAAALNNSRIIGGFPLESV